MNNNQLLIEAYNRIQAVVHQTVDGLTPANLAFRPTDKSNSIAWLVWHLTRLQDDHLTELVGGEQIWIKDGWVQRFKLDLDEKDTGYGHSPEDVAAVYASAELLTECYDDVHKRTIAYIGKLKPEDYAKTVDYNYNPPVTLAVRLISVLSDDLQHAGQAAYLRGLLGQ